MEARGQLKDYVKKKDDYVADSDDSPRKASSLG